MTFIDGLLNRITMYRLVVCYLIALLVLAGVLGAFGVMPYTPVALAFSTGVFMLASLLANKFFAWAFDAVPGSDSTLITALILALIVTPVLPSNIAGIVLISFISFWAVGSKYLFAIGKKHLFNPAALGVAASALIVGTGATWWIAGNLYVLPVLLIGGLLIVRKIRRFDLVLSFTVFAFISVVLTSLAHPLSSLVATLTHSSFFFLALVMLTEPATMPPSRNLRIIYGAIAGLLFAPAIHIFSFYLTPELALLIANVFAFAVSPKGRHMLTLQSRTKIATDTYEFAFASPTPLLFRAGQYLEWTLPEHNEDDRGNRRYFTIASGPSEQGVRLGVKFYTPMSTFKKALLKLQVGDTIATAQLAGDFVLPKDPKKKLAFIAGGIGVTPFRSMVGEMIVTGKPRDAVMLYSNKTPEDVAYREVFDQAATTFGMKTVYAGLIDTAMIIREIPDYKERTFYISGPHGMVEAFRAALSGLGLPPTQVKTDYFPGFA
jgi:ferredoxin-NADP reductase